MSNNYPAPPSWRMAHDRDGTQWYDIRDGVVNPVSHENIVAVNNESASEGIPAPSSGATLMELTAIFPELRDIEGYYLASTTALSTAILEVLVSANTTNGVDGDWTALPAEYDLTSVRPRYRTEITTALASAVRAIQFKIRRSTGTSGIVWAVHLYGSIASGENPDRLELWHPTLDERASPAHFDWGDVIRGSSQSRTFRVKNLSATLTALDVTVGMEVLTDSSPASLLDMHQLSADGGATFLPQVDIGNLNPEAVSAPVTLRRAIASDAQLSVWAFRLIAEAADWQ